MCFRRGPTTAPTRLATAISWPRCRCRDAGCWSYTENRYAPPPPYPSPDPFEPFAVAAVQLADEGVIVLGKVVEGTLAADLKVGMEMELTTMPLFVDDDGVERVVHAWRIAS